MEFWIAIPGYKGLYDVSNLGRVRSRPHQCAAPRKQFRMTKWRLLKGRPNSTGYLRVCLFDADNNKTYWFIHRLVAVSFMPNPDNKPQVNHINSNRTDN